jgi:hypothetical protein
VNGAFTTALEGLLDRTVDLTGDVRVALVRSSYTPDLDFDAVLTDLGGAINGRSGALTGADFTAGAFDADDTTLTADAAVACNALVLYVHTGDDSTARLVAYVDDPAIGLPFTPAAGQGVNIVWDNGPGRIFSLQRSPA